MEARHAAGWFAPHMSTVLQLRAALGGKDALLTALHEARYAKILHNTIYIIHNIR